MSSPACVKGYDTPAKIQQAKVSSFNNFYGAVHAVITLSASPATVSGTVHSVTSKGTDLGRNAGPDRRGNNFNIYN